MPLKNPSGCICCSIGRFTDCCEMRFRKCMTSGGMEAAAVGPAAGACKAKPNQDTLLCTKSCAEDKANYEWQVFSWKVCSKPYCLQCVKTAK